MRPPRRRLDARPPARFDGRYQRAYTHADLVAGSNRVATLLSDLGLSRGDRVCTDLPRIPKYNDLHLGTLKAGAAFSAINERDGREGIRYRVEDTGVSPPWRVAKPRAQ